MTIAACYLSAEGVVLGADSTTTMTVLRPGPTPIGTPHHFNYAQKVFEIGQNSTLGILYGMDGGIAEAILRSGKWTGTLDELFALMQPFFLGQPLHLPIREAIDWIHSSIHTTIKALKFSHLPPVCGGAVEVAVITTDRQFRWVRHKRLDSAIALGGFDGS